MYCDPHTHFPYLARRGRPRVRTWTYSGGRGWSSTASWRGRWVGCWSGTRDSGPAKARAAEDRHVEVPRTWGPSFSLICWPYTSTNENSLTYNCQIINIFITKIFTHPRLGLWSKSIKTPTKWSVIRRKDRCLVDVVWLQWRAICWYWWMQLEY